MEKTIIALTGPKGVGKSSVARAIESNHWQNACIYSFADPIRKMLRQIIPEEVMRDTELKEQPIEWLGKTPREIMQTLGTDWGRNMINDNIWIEAMKRQVEASPYDIAIIDDCRFANEIDAVHDMGGSVFRLYRDGIDYTGEHESEQELSGIDCSIDAGDTEAAANAIEQIILD